MLTVRRCIAGTVGASLSTVLSLALSTILLAALLAPGMSLAQASRPPTLNSLAGWTLSAMGDSVVGNLVSTSPGSFTGQLQPVNLPPQLRPTVAGFRTGNQGPYTVALIYPSRNLTSFIASLKGTAADDISFSSLVVLMTPPALVRTQLQVPARVGTVVIPVIAGTTRTPAAATSIFSAVTVANNSARTLQLAGANLASLQISGTIDARMLSGTVPPGSQMETDVINAIDLSMALGGNLGLAGRKPAFLTLGNSAMLIKGVSGKLSSGITTSATVNVGGGLQFGAITINYDPVKQVLSIQSTGAGPAGSGLNLPVSNASITQLAFSASIDEQTASKDQFGLVGKYSVANSAPKDFSVALSGGSPAQYAVSLQADMTLGQLLGWQPPGLDTLVIGNVAAGDNYTSGTLTLHGLNFTVVAFKGSGQSVSNAAFAYNGTLALPSMAARLTGTPLADLELLSPVFVLVPAANGSATVQLPAPVRTQLGVSSMALKPGLYLSTQAKPLGDIASLLSKIGYTAATLPLKGNLDPSLLASTGSTLAQAFISAIDLSVPLGTVTIPGGGKAASVSNAYLYVKGLANGSGISASVEGNIAVAAGSSTQNFDSTIRLVKTTAGDSLSVNGTSASIWSAPLGLSWLTLRNLTLSGAIGPTNSVAIAGLTDAGNVRGLTVSADLSEKPGQATDFSLTLSGADIPFADIPGLAALPQANEFSLSNLVLSSQAIGGTLKSRFPLLNAVQAVAFSSAGHWNLAVLLQGLTFSQLLPLPGVATPLLGNAKMDTLAIVISASGVNSTMAALPPSASRVLNAIYGANRAQVSINSGVNLLTTMDAAQLGSAAAAMLPASQKLILQGGIGGMFGDPVSLSLSADIPTIVLPASLKFATLPAGFKTSFFINLSAASIAAGINIATTIAARVSDQTVSFDSTLAFQLGSAGVSIDLQGKTLGPWKNAVGIHGLTLDSGTLLDLKIAPSSEVTLTFSGTSHIGKRVVSLTGSASLLVEAGLIDKGAFQGKLSEIDIEDLMALTNDVVAAAGGKPVTNSLPVLKLTSADLAFASPGVAIPQINLTGGGIRISGDLWFLLNSQALGKALVQISESGMIMDGAMADFKVGPVAFANNKLDSKATLSPPATPYFKVNGGVSLFGKSQTIGLSATLTHIAMQTDLDLGQLMQFDFQASAGAPAGGLSPLDLGMYDMSLAAHLTSDIPAWLRGDGKKPVTAAISTIRTGLAKFTTDLNNAQKSVDSLNTQITQAKIAARKNAQNAQNNLTAAENKVNSLQNQINQMAASIAADNRQIQTCNFTKAVKILVVTVNVPDVVRNATCAVDNVSWEAKVASLTVQQAGLVAGKTAADQTLAALKSGIAGTDVADLDPKVVELEGLLTAANGVLATARQMTQGMANADKLMDTALNQFGQGDLFVLTDGLIQGSLQKAIGGAPVVLGMSFTSKGVAHQLGFALSFTDPLFTLNQLDALALFLFSKALDAAAAGGAQLPPGLSTLVQQAYLAKANAVAAELAKAMAANGLS